MDPTTPQSDKHIYCVFAARNFGWRAHPVSDQSNPDVDSFSISLFFPLFGLPSKAHARTHLGFFANVYHRVAASDDFTPIAQML